MLIRKKSLEIIELIILLVAISASIALTAISIIIDARFAKAYYDIHTSFLILIVSEIFFNITYIFWNVSQYYRVTSYGSVNVDVSLEAAKVSFYASKHTLQLFFSSFTLIFAIMSLGSGIAIANLSFRDAHDNYVTYSSNGGLDSQRPSFFSSSFKYLIVLLPLFICCQFLKGVLMAMDTYRVILSNSQLNSLLIVEDNDENFSKFYKGSFDSKLLNEDVKNLETNKSECSNDIDIDRRKQSKEKHLSKITDDEIISYSDISCDGQCIRKTLIRVPTSAHLLTLHSANITPPVTSTISFKDASVVLEGKISSDTRAQSIMITQDNESATDNEENKKDSRYRSALSQRTHRNQLSPVHEPSKKEYLESPVFRLKANRGLMISVDNGKNRKLNTSLLESFDRDLSNVLPEESSRSESSLTNLDFETSGNLEKCKKVLENHKNLKALKVYCTNGNGINKIDKRIHSCAPSSPPPKLSDEDQYTKKLKPLHLADQFSAKGESYRNNSDELTIHEGKNETCLKKCYFGERKSEVASIISWDSNYDPLSKDSTQEVRSIPANTLWPFSRTSPSPNSGRFSPSPNSGRFSPSPNSGRFSPKIVVSSPVTLKYGKETIGDDALNTSDSNFKYPAGFERQVNSIELAKKGHTPEDSFTFENVMPFHNENGSSNIQSKETVATDVVVSDYKFPSAEFPSKHPFRYDGQAEVVVLQDSTKENGDRRGILKENFQLESALMARNPQKPLLSYSTTEINTLNNVRGEKRKSLLRLNHYESTSPRKSKKSGGRSPLVRIGTNFHETRRSTVIFDDDFDFALDNELSGLAEEKYEYEKSMSYDGKDVEANSFSIGTRRMKNFSISSIKQIMNHIHSRSLSVDYLRNSKSNMNSYAVAHNRHKSLSNFHHHPGQQQFSWKFANEISYINDESLINDIIQHSDDYDFRSNIDSTSQNLTADSKNTSFDKRQSDNLTYPSSLDHNTDGRGNLNKRVSFEFDKKARIRNILAFTNIMCEDSYVASDKSIPSELPSGYIGEYDKEKWGAMKLMKKKQS